MTDPVVDAALRRSGGNPYQLTELLADLGGRDPAALIAVDDRPEPQPPTPLTARERDVIACLAAGMANKQIARSLGISVRTVTVHVSNLLRKTGTASRTDAAVWAVRHDVGPTVAEPSEPVDPIGPREAGSDRTESETDRIGAEPALVGSADARGR